MLDNVNKLLSLLGNRHYPLGKTFDILLTKNDKTRRYESPDELKRELSVYVLSRILREERDRSCKAEVLQTLVNKWTKDGDIVMSKIICFLFLLANDRNRDYEIEDNAGCASHPKYNSYSSEKYKNGKFDGSYKEIKYLVLDRIDPDLPYFQRFANKLYGPRGKVLKEKLEISVSHMIETSLFSSDRSFRYRDILHKSQTVTSPPKKKFFLDISPDILDESPNLNENCHSISSNHSRKLYFDQFQNIPENQPPSRGPICTWEERKNYKTKKYILPGGIFDLKCHELEMLCESYMPSGIRRISEEKLAQCFKFTMVGLENFMIPDWSNKIIQPYCSKLNSYEAIENAFRKAINVGEVVDEVRLWKNNMLELKAMNPIHYSIGLSVSTMFDFIERTLLNLNLQSLGALLIHGEKLVHLVTFIHQNAAPLTHNEDNQDVNDLFDHQSPFSSFYIYPLVVLIQTSTEPLMNSLNTWIYEGIWTNVLGQTIRHQSRFNQWRNRTYWTKSYIKEDVISPIFIKCIESILLVGKSFNLLRLLRPDHFSFGLPLYQHKIKLRYGQDLDYYQSRLEQYYDDVEAVQISYEKKYFSEEFGKREEVRKARRLENEAIDKTNAERARLKIAKIKQMKLEARAAYTKQIEEKKQLAKEFGEQLLLEENQRRKVIEDKDRMIEQEKLSMLREYENKVRILEGKSPIKHVDNSPSVEMEIDQQFAVELVGDAMDTHSQPEKVLTQSDINKRRNEKHSIDFGILSKPQGEIELGDKHEQSANAIPKRKTTNRHMSDSAFVTGSMELKRNVLKPKPKVVFEDPMSDAEFKEQAIELTTATITDQWKAQPESRVKYLKFFKIDDDETPEETIDPLTFRDDVKRSIELPVTLSVKMANRALMFELLEKQKLLSLINGLAGTVLFQDGVFANSFCDQLFVHVETKMTNLIGSLHSILEESKKSATEKDAILHSKALRLSYSPLQNAAENPTQHLLGVQLYMDITWPANIIIDDNAMNIYKKINKFIVFIKYAQWSIDKLWLQRNAFNNSTLMLTRAEMGNFLRGLQQHCIRYVILNQGFKFRAKIIELNKRGELNVDSLFDAHMNFLTKCRSQCLLSPVAVAFYKFIRRALTMILQFCALFHEYTVCKEESTLTKLLAICSEFRRSMTNIMEISFKIVNNLELEERQSFQTLIDTLDFTCFYASPDVKDS